MKKLQFITILAVPFVVCGCEPTVYSTQPAPVQIIDVDNQSSGNVNPPPSPPPTPTYPRTNKVAKAVVVDKVVQNNDNKESERASNGRSTYFEDTSQ